MVDIQDRRYLAQCTQQLSSSALAGLLDMLLLNHPSEVVERKGGGSYHIDFGTLSAPAYADVREFIKKALGDDDDFGFSENERKVINAITGFGDTKGQSGVEKNKDKAGIAASAITEAPSVHKIAQVPPAKATEEENRSSVEVTPSLPYPSSAVATRSKRLQTDETKKVTSLSPEQTSTKQLKRVHLSPPEEPKPKSEKPSPSGSAVTAVSSGISGPRKDDIHARYYNGERVWRNAMDDLHFDFHGVDVVLLSLQTETKRPWKCGICEKAFVSKDKIVNHVQQHSGEKIHECPTCKGKFSSKHYLKEHQKRVHLFHCHYCEEVFDSFDDLHVHSAEVHPKQTALKECSCKKGCNNSRCSCFKNGLNCTATCQCHNCNNGN